MTRITLKPARIALLLGAVAAALVATHIAAHIWRFFINHSDGRGMMRWVNLDVEGNIPTAYSTLIILIAAGLLALIATLERGTPLAVHWVVLCAGFLLMAADEAFMLHEMMESVTRRFLGEDRPSIFYFSWPVAGIAVVLAVGVFFVPFLRRLSAGARRSFMTSGAIYVSGAVGFELIGGWFTKLHGNENFAYTMITACEESLEMAGVILFIYALLTYLKDHHASVELRTE